MWPNRTEFRRCHVLQGGTVDPEATEKVTVLGTMHDAQMRRSTDGGGDVHSPITEIKNKKAWPLSPSNRRDSSKASHLVCAPADGGERNPKKSPMLGQWRLHRAQLNLGQMSEIERGGCKLAIGSMLKRGANNRGPLAQETDTSSRVSFTVVSTKAKPRVSTQSPPRRGS